MCTDLFSSIDINKGIVIIQKNGGEDVVKFSPELTQHITVNREAHHINVSVSEKFYGKVEIIVNISKLADSCTIKLNNGVMKVNDVCKHSNFLLNNGNLDLNSRVGSVTLKVQNGIISGKLPDSYVLESCSVGYTGRKLRLQGLYQLSQIDRQKERNR